MALHFEQPPARKVVRTQRSPNFFQRALARGGLQRVLLTRQQAPAVDVNGEADGFVIIIIRIIIIGCVIGGA
eukprot:3240766-Pyramimonas_sp.AAC.1